MKFDDNKHGYLLPFPWNFPEVIEEFEIKEINLKTRSSLHLGQRITVSITIDTILIYIDIRIK